MAPTHDETARISLIVSVLRSASGGMLRASTTSASSVRARNCATCRSDAPRAMLTCTFGCRRAMYVRKGVISTAPGPDPRPTRCCLTSARFARNPPRRRSPASSTSRRARATTVKPTGVSSTFSRCDQKAGAEVILQRLDAAAQGRLRQICLCCCPTERARFRHCQKVLDLSKIQGLLLAFARWFVADLNQRGGLRPQIHSRKSS